MKIVTSASLHGIDRSYGGAFMRIIVVGPGAIGCLFAAFLAKGGHDVAILDHTEERAKHIAESGIRVEDGPGDFTVRVQAESHAPLLGPARFVFICVKAYDTAEACRNTLPLVTKTTLVVSLQNGSGNTDTLSRFVPESQLLCATTAQASLYMGEGHVRHTGSGPTLLAPVIGDLSEPARELAGSLSQSGIDTRAVTDCRAMLWSKLVINAAVNPLTAIHKVANGILLEDPALRARMANVAREAAAVARADGISLDFNDEVQEVERICRATSGNESSMLTDLRGNRKTEIDQITGTIVARAGTLGIPVPENTKLLEAVRALEQHDDRGEDSLGR